MVIQAIGWFALIISWLSFAAVFYDKTSELKRQQLQLCGLFLIAAVICFK